MLLFPELQREHAQIISTIALCTGAILMAMGEAPAGMAAIGAACWVMVMNDSILLIRVQNEMHSAFETLGKKRESEIQDLLYFLRRTQTASCPFESLEGSKKLCSEIGYPSMVLSSTHQIIQANLHMHKLLGYKVDDLNERGVHEISDPVMLSTIASRVSRKDVALKDSMISQYAYVHKNGHRIFGQMDAHKIGMEGFMVVFHPSEDCLISYDEIRRMADQSRV